jgi:hypothetical protein
VLPANGTATGLSLKQKELAGLEKLLFQAIPFLASPEILLP